MFKQGKDISYFTYMIIKRGLVGLPEQWVILIILVGGKREKNIDLFRKI